MEEGRESRKGAVFELGSTEKELSDQGLSQAHAYVHRVSLWLNSVSFRRQLVSVISCGLFSSEHLIIIGALKYF